jgi:hypothetical protein
MGVGRRSCARYGVLALALNALGAESARAAGEPDMPEECGTRALFESELKQRLGDDAPVASVTVSIAPRPSHFHLRVQIGSDVRELDDASCSELFRASVVVAVAMLMHPPHEPAQAPPPSTPPPSPPRELPRFAVDAGVGLNLGTLPKPVLALELEGKTLWRYWGVSLNLRYLAPSQKLESSSKGVKLQALGAGVAGIFRPSRLWEARLGFAAQRLSGQGAGVTDPQTDSAWAAGPTLGLELTPLQVRPFWLGLGAEGQLNAVRGRFQILHYFRPVSEAPYEIYAVPWLAGSAFVRLGLVW